jgi:LysR family cyn operon transcriptional activator
MRTDYIKTALKVAEIGHFSLAADALFMSHPAALYQIRTLEKELGFPLFDGPSNKKRLLTPTMQGAKWLVLARKAMELLDQGTVEMKVTKRVKRCK